MKLDITDIVQGINAYEQEYGYAGIDGRGGQFFDWMPTVAETLATIRDDETDAPENWPQRAYQEVRGLIRRNHRRVMDRQDKAGHMFGCSL